MKKIHLLRLVLAAVLLPLCLSCQREDPEIVFDNTQFEIPSGGGSQTITITTNYAWTATTSDPWLQVSPASGNKGTSTLTIRAEANDKSTTRKGNVTITCRDMVRGVSISQLPKLDQSLFIRHTNASFAAPSFTGSSMAGTVKWGDGSEETYKKDMTHTYSAAGNHTVEINATGAYSFKLESVAGVTEIDFEKF